MRIATALITALVLSTSLSKAQQLSALFEVEPNDRRADLQQEHVLVRGGNMLQAIGAAHNDAIITIKIPTASGEEITLDLEKFEVFAPNARRGLITREGRRELAPTPSVHLRGIVRGDEKSRVVISMFRTWTIGRIDRSNDERLVLSPIKGRNNAVVLAPLSTLEMYPWECASEEIAPPPSRFTKEGPAPQAGTLKLIELAVEGDYDYYLDHGRDEDRAIEYAESVIAATNDIYERDVEAEIEISQIDIWGVVDPYPGTTSGAILGQFRAEWRANHNNVDRTLAHLFSGVNRIGGVAYLNALCSKNIGYAVSGLNNNVNYPRTGYVWDTDVTSHELGHNVGSRHTHSCTWNPPIDSCWDAEGSCYTGRKAVRGTIMSYCHLTRSGKNLNFNSRVATLMKNRLAAATCVKTITDLEVSAGTDVFYCEGEEGFLRGSVSGGTPPLDVKWTPASGLDNDTTLVQPVNVQRSTDYILTVTDNRGSKGVDTVRVTVHPRVRAELNESYDVCAGSALRLQLQNVGGTAPHQFRWQSSDYDTTTSTSTLVIRPSEDQIMTVSVIDANGCGDQATTTIKMYDPPVVTIDALDNTFCKGDSVRVIARIESSDPLVYEWYRNDRGFAVGGPSIDVNALVGDEFTVIVKNEVGCSDTASITLDVHDIEMRTMYETIDVPAIAPCKNTFQSWVTILNEGSDPITIHEVDGEGLKATIEGLPYTLDPGTSHVFRVDIEFDHGASINGSITLREATCGREITIDVRGEHGTVSMVADPDMYSFNAVNGCLVEAVRTVDVEVTNDSRSTITITRGHAREHDRRMRVISDATIEAGQTATVSFEEVLPVLPSITTDEIEVTYESHSCTGTLVFDARTPVFNVTGEYPDEIRFDSPVSPELEDVRQEISVTVNSPSEEPATVTSVSVTGPFSTSLEVGQTLPVNTEVPVQVMYHPSKVDDGVESVGQLNFEVNSCDNFTPVTLRAIKNVVSVDEDELVTNVDRRVVGDELTLVATNAQVDILNLKGERVMRLAVQDISVIDVSRLVPGVHVVLINESDGRQERLTILVE